MSGFPIGAQVVVHIEYRNGGGSQVAGLLDSETDEWLYVRPNFGPPGLVAVPKADVAAVWVVT
jgi:hypothetical protein